MRHIIIAAQCFGQQARFCHGKPGRRMVKLRTRQTLHARIKRGHKNLNLRVQWPDHVPSREVEHRGGGEKKAFH